jgi:hypothetical protein
LGALLAVPAGGAVLARSIYRGGYAGLGEIERAALALSIGLAATTIYLVLLAHAGLFHPVLAGGPGWVVAAVLFATRVIAPGRELARSRRSWLRREPWPAIAAAMAFALPVLYLPGADEPLAVGRDQQLYADFGVRLGREGHFEYSMMARGPGDRALMDGALRREGREPLAIPGVVAEPSPGGLVLVPYLPAGIAAWIAVAWWLGGVALAYATNAFVWPLGLWLAFVLARRPLGSPTAFAACAIVAVLPATFWSAGVTLTEPMGFALGVSLATSLAYARGGLTYAGPLLCLVAGAMIRLDALLLGFAMTLALAVRAWSLPHDREVQAEAASGSGAVVLATCLVFAFYIAWYPSYLDFNRTQAALLAVGLASGVVLARSAGPLGRRLGGTAGLARQAFLLAAIVLVAGFSYGALIRPHLEPFAIIANGTGLDGTRDFREESIHNLAAYVSWPLLVLALGGGVAAMDAFRRHRVRLAGAFVTFGLLVASVLFLAYPQVSPDHPFAIRRFVPVVIPGIAFFACYAVVRILARARGRMAPFAGAAVALLVVPFLVGLPWDALRLAEGRGLSQQIAALAKRLPPDVVVADQEVSALAPDLVLHHERPVVPVNFADSTRAALALAWAAERHAAGVSALLLHRLGQFPVNAELESAPGIVELQRTRLAPTWSPPATEIVTEREVLQLSRVHVLPPTTDRIFGGAPLWGAEETGFLRPEVAPFGTFRWTDGAATIAVPTLPGNEFDRIKVDLFALERPGRATRVEISVNGNVVLSEALPGGISTRIVAAPVGSAEREIVLRISSDTATPRSLGIGSSDQQLGVGVIGLRMLRSGELTADSVGGGTEGFGFRLRPLVDGAPIAIEAHERHVALPLYLSNDGTLPWPTLRESGRIEGAVQVGARWYRQGDRSAVLSDQRWTVELGLHPGDSTTIAARFAPEDRAGRRLPPGRYDLKLGLVRETIAWVAEAVDDASVVAIEVR